MPGWAIALMLGGPVALGGVVGAVVVAATPVRRPPPRTHGNPLVAAMVAAEASTPGPTCRRSYAGLRAGMEHLGMGIPSATADERSAVQAEYEHVCGQLPKGLRSCLMRGLQHLGPCQEAKGRATQSELEQLARLKQSWNLMQAAAGHGPPGSGHPSPPGAFTRPEREELPL